MCWLFVDPELEIDIDRYNREYMAQSEVSYWRRLKAETVLTSQISNSF